MFKFPTGVHKISCRCLEIDLGDDAKLCVGSYKRNYDPIFIFTLVVSDFVKFETVPAHAQLPYTYLPQTWEYFCLHNCVYIAAGYQSVCVSLREKCYDNPHLGAASIDKETYEFHCKQLDCEEKKVLEAQEVVIHDTKGFQDVLNNTKESDFTIVCKDDKTIPVHSLILTTFWPFFAKMMSNECKEKTDKVLRLDYPAEWVQVLVAYIYKQPFEVSFEQSVGVAQLANQYMLPELEKEVFSRLEKMVSSETTVAELLQAWETSRQVGNDKMKVFFAKLIGPMVKKDNGDALKGLNVEQLLELFVDALSV